MFGLFKKTQAEPPEFQHGQIWTLQSGVYQGVNISIAKVENHPVQKEVIHIRVLGPIEDAEGRVTPGVSHLPFAKEGLQKSGLKLSQKKADVSDEWLEGYGMWNEAALKGEAGVFTLTVSEAIDIVFQQLPSSGGAETQIMDPNDIALSEYHHDGFPDAFLSRIRATTEAFEEIDGVSFEQAVDLYRRDVDPESNIVIWEEMVRVYNLYCAKNDPDFAVKQDVYNSLLLASMFPKAEVPDKVASKALSKGEIAEIISDYGLAPQPIGVYEN